MFFAGEDDHRDNIWALSMEVRTERPATNLAGRRGSMNSSLTTDGKYLYFLWNETLGDIWVMDVVTDESE